MRKIKPFLLSVCMLAATVVKSQLPDYHLQLFDYTYGIQTGTITSITRDKNGFLWVLYPRHIQRFDGRNIISYKLDSYFTAMTCDDQNRIWVTAQDQVMMYTDSLRRFEPVTVAIKDSALFIGEVFQVHPKKVWLITNAGICELDKTGKVFRPVLNDLPIRPYYSVRVFAKYDHTLFIRHGSHLYRYDMLTKKTDSLPDLEINKVFPLNADSALVSTWNNDSYWYNFQRRTILPANPPARVKDANSPSFSVRSVREYAPGKFLMASREGIFCYDNKQQRFERLKFFLYGRKVASNDFSNFIHLDSEGYAWLATIDGVARFSLSHQPIGLRRIRQQNDTYPAAIDNIRKIVEDNDGNLWMATGHGFVCWQKSRDKWETFLPVQGAKDRLAHPSIRAMLFDGKYLLLGPTDLGIWLFDVKSRSYRRPAYENDSTRIKSENDFFDDACTLQNGHHLFLGRDALYLLDGKTYQLRELKLPPGKENTNFVHQGKNGIIWLTTGRGLHCLDANLQYLGNVELPFKRKFISCGFVLTDDRFLFACADGLFTATWKNGKAEVKKFTNRFDQIYVTTLYQDRNGNIWATSDDGIYRFDPASSKLNLFDYTDNVQGYGFNGNSWFRNREGVLFLGGVNGMNYLVPEKFALPDENLCVFIQEARIGDKDSLYVDFSKEAILPYHNRSLEALFVSPYFNNPSKVNYRYRLEGYDDEWKLLGNNNQVRFTSLFPGTYKLQVEGSLNNVDWVPSGNNFRFRIKPPFWLTWWFAGATAMFIGSLTWFFINNRNKKIAAKQEELEAQKAINYFASSMYAQTSVESILWDVVKNCIAQLQFEDCVIYLLDEERNMLVQKAAHGPKSPRSFVIEEPLEIPVGTGITGSVAATGKAELIRDTSRDPRYIVDDERRFSEIAVPILADGKVLGVIDCEHSKKGFFTQKHLTILTTIASLCSSKIIKAKAETAKQQTEQVLMDTQRKMADVEMQALRAQMNPHFIFNCLNSINRYIVKSDQATASLYLTRFAKLIRLILDNSNSSSVTLTNDLEALRLYIEMESIRFEKQFSYTIVVEDDVHPDTVYVPPLIIQPYVENAIWHGLLHKDQSGHLLIRISRAAPSMLECVIEDNGVGRDKARALRSKSAAQKKSLGMKLTEDRLVLLSRQTSLDASVQVEDLLTSEGTPAGTKVILNIPVDD